MSSHDDTSFQELAHAVAQACGAPEFLRELEGLLARAEQQVDALSPACRACGGCCDFARAGHRLYATTGEIALLIARSPQPAGEVLPLHCAYQIGGACTARSGRPLGCRMFFCDEKTTLQREEIYEWHHHAIAALHQRCEISYQYAELTTFLTGLAEVTMQGFDEKKME